MSLARRAKIKSVSLVNREDTGGVYYTRINESEIRVGDVNDAFANDSCGVTVSSGGVYSCNLKGKYIGLVQKNNDYQNVCEIRVFSWEHVEGEGTASSSSVYLDGSGATYTPSHLINPIDLWVANYLFH